MTKIVVLTSEEDAPQNIGVVVGDVSAEQAQAMCLAAARHFADMAMEAEIERRVAEMQVKAGGEQAEGP